LEGLSFGPVLAFLPLFPTTIGVFMKTKRFLSSVVLFAVSLAFFACSNDLSEQGNNISQDEEGGSSSSVELSSFSIGNDGGSSSSVVLVGETYLGYGYDVIKSSYINRGDVKIAHPILSKEKMFQDAIIDSAKMSAQKYETFAGSSIKQFYQERNSGINVGADLSGIVGFLFSGKYRSEFSAIESEDKSVYYSRVRSYIYIQDNYIKNATPQNLSKYLTEFFISDLEALDAPAFLDRYGTHIFIRYYKGGSLEANYTYTGTKLATNTEVKKAAEASFFVFSGGSNSSDATGREELENNMSFKYYTYGGREIGSTNMQELMRDYSSWVNSIQSYADICGIDDFAQSLMPIWELANSVNQSKAAALKTEFQNRAREQGIALPVARTYKVADYIHKNTSGTSTVSLTPPEGGFIAEIEIYALGAGGGGQGGNKNGTFYVSRGSGGAGGGGSAAYLKLNNLGLNKNEQVSLSVTIGSGGAGGGSNTNTFENAGCSGKNGGETTVSWSIKSITLKAPGGSGGGSGNANCGGEVVNGGAGGTGGTVNPANSPMYADKLFESGKKGSNGYLDSSQDEVPMASNGGTAAKIDDKGTLPSFGGGSGSTRTSGSSTRSTAQNGGGGTSGHMDQSGTSGGSGLVTIVYKYYMEE
jgi:hypothetical protein